MSGITHLVEQMKIPRFVRVKQYFPHSELSEQDIISLIAENFSKPE